MKVALEDDGLRCAVYAAKRIYGSHSDSIFNIQFPLGSVRLRSAVAISYCTISSGLQAPFLQLIAPNFFSVFAIQKISLI